MGIDIGKNSFHVVGLDQRGAIVLRQKWSRGQIETRIANMPPCLIGMEACVGAHHLSRKLRAHGHDARLMPAKYVRAYSKGQKNDFRDAEAIAEALRTRGFAPDARIPTIASNRALYPTPGGWQGADAVRGVGYALDRWLGTSPWFLLGGLIAGLVVGFYGLARTVWHK